MHVKAVRQLVYVAVWKIAVGRFSLYLLDTDIEINDPWNRGISAHMYSGAELDLTAHVTALEKSRERSCQKTVS